MTASATTASLDITGATHTAAKPIGVARSFWVVVGVSVLSAFLIALPNLADPMIRHDDYPAYFSDAPMFWAKTLHEGRWLNWLWHLREVVTPAWVNFAVYQLFWGLFAGALAWVAMGARASLPLVIGVAVLILLSPSARVISLWFNTLIPGLALVAVYALLACILSQRVLRRLLLPFTMVTFTAYTTYPLLLLAVCLARTERRSLSDLVGLLAWFTLCFAAAVFTVYAINWQVHGVFGVPLDDWRNATPASDLGGLLANLPVFAETLGFLAHRLGFSHPSLALPSFAFFLALFVASTLVLARRAPMEALYLHSGLWIGMGLMALQSLKLGVIVPPRAFIFVWVFYALVLGRALWVLAPSTGTSVRMLRNCFVIVIGAQLISSLDFYNDFRPWQSETRALAAQLTPDDSPILVTGNIKTLPVADQASLQDELAFSFRMKLLTGREAIFCGNEPELCESWYSESTPGTLNHLFVEGATARLSTNGS